MDKYENEILALRLMLDGRRNNAQSIIKNIPRERLQKLSHALDYFAAIVDDQLIRVDKRS